MNRGGSLKMGVALSYYNGSGWPYVAKGDGSVTFCPGSVTF